MANWWETPKELNRENIVIKGLSTMANPMNVLNPADAYKHVSDIVTEGAQNENSRFAEMTGTAEDRARKRGLKINVQNGYGNQPVAPTPPQVSDSDSRMNDIQSGIAFGSPYFGHGNPEMDEILKTRRERAMGLNANEMQLMMERASGGINKQMQTGLRALHGAQAGSGVRGGAAAAQSIPVVNQANEARAGAERDIALADMARRSSELGNYEHSLTGERAGLLGTGLSFATLGSADRANARENDLIGKGLTDYQKMADEAKTPEEKAWFEKVMKHYGDMFQKINPF